MEKTARALYTKKKKGWSIQESSGLLSSVTILLLREREGELRKRHRERQSQEERWRVRKKGF